MSHQLLAMGGYGIFVWPAFSVTILGMIGMAGFTYFERQQVKKTLFSLLKQHES